MTQKIFHNLSKFYNLISTAYCYKEGHPLVDKYMPKVISGHNKISSLYIMKSLFILEVLVCLVKTSNS